MVVLPTPPFWFAHAIVSLTSIAVGASSLPPILADVASSAPTRRPAEATTAYDPTAATTVAISASRTLGVDSLALVRPPLRRLDGPPARCRLSRPTKQARIVPRGTCARRARPQTGSWCLRTHGPAPASRSLPCLHVHLPSALGRHSRRGPTGASAAHAWMAKRPSRAILPAGSAARPVPPPSFTWRRG